MLDEDDQHEDINTDYYIARIEYLSKHDTIEAVKDYHALISRPYKVQSAILCCFQQYVRMKVALSWIALRLVDNISVQTNVNQTLVSLEMLQLRTPENGQQND